MATLEQIREAVAVGPLAARSAEVLALASRATHLVTTKADAPLPLGSSRIGGEPDLPSGIEWPLWNDEPQSFIAQLDLSDFVGLPGCEVLPAAGHLVFFYSARQDTWGFDPKDRGSWRVIFLEPGAELARSATPASMPDGGVFQACSVAHQQAVTLPPWESKPIERLASTDPEADAYSELMELVHGWGNHQLLGQPDQIQGDITAECQMATNGLYAGDPSGWQDPRAPQVLRDSDDWRLLLQIASDEQPQMMWGDAGYLYFCLRTEDFEADRFDRTWMVLQCA